MRLSTNKTTSVNNISKPINDWLQQNIKFIGIVFQISILNNQDIAGGLGNSRMQRRALPFVNFVMKNLQP